MLQGLGSVVYARQGVVAIYTVIWKLFMDIITAAVDINHQNQPKHLVAAYAKAACGGAVTTHVRLAVLLIIVIIVVLPTTLVVQQRMLVEVVQLRMLKALKVVMLKPAGTLIYMVTTNLTQ